MEPGTECRLTRNLIRYGTERKESIAFIKRHCDKCEACRKFYEEEGFREPAANGKSLIQGDSRSLMAKYTLMGAGYIGVVLLVTITLYGLYLFAI